MAKWYAILSSLECSPILLKFLDTTWNRYTQKQDDRTGDFTEDKPMKNNMLQLKILCATTISTLRPIADMTFLVVVIVCSVAMILTTILHGIDYVFHTEWTRPWFNWFYVSLIAWLWVGIVEFVEAWKKQYKEQWVKQLEPTADRWQLRKCKVPAKHKMYHVTGSNCPCKDPEG